MGGPSRVLVDPADPTPNRRHIARSLGLLFLIQGTLGEGWLLLPHEARHAQAVVLICVLAQVLGIWMRRGGFDAAPLWVLKAIITLGTLLAAAGCVFTGAGTGFAFFFLWVTPYAVYFGLRQAAFQTAIAVLGLVGSRMAIADGQFVASQVGQWLLPAATIIVVSSIVHQLTRELGRADRERLVSERERAEAEARRAASERERAHREAAMARLGRLALRASDRALLLDETVRVLTETLRVEHCAIHELQEDGTHMRAVAAVGFANGEDVPADEQRLGGYVLAGDEPIIVWEWASERRFTVPSLRDRGIRATAAAAIRGRSGAFGIIAVHSATVGEFSGEEGQWLQSIADLLASALDRERSEAVMRHQSLHDALTGLPNRALLFDRVEHAFSRAERFSLGVAVLLLDVDGFKTVNDSLGHQAGDELLVEIGHRLQEVVRTSDTVARLGGDEFVVLAEVESDRRGLRDRRPHRAGLGAAVRGRLGRGLLLGVRRHRGRPRGAAARQDAARGRRRDVPRQGARPRPRRDVRRGDAPRRLRAAAHRVRPAPRAGARRVPRPLPADRRHRHAAPDGRRGARALAAPDARPRRPGRVHPARRGDRPDRTARRVGARARRRAGRATGAGASPTSPLRVAVNVSASSSPAPSSSTRSAPPCGLGPAARVPGPGDHRERSSSRTPARRARPLRGIARHGRQGAASTTSAPATRRWRT